MRKISLPSILSGFLLLTIAITFEYGCKHDPVYTNVCFESDVLPIFATNCTKSGCHNSKDATSGIVLTTYDDIMNSGIKAGKAKQSAIYKAITGKEEQMPPDSKLTTDQIAMIRSWIETGAKNVVGCAPPVVINDTNSPGGCDTVNVTYTGTIKPIIDACCLNCHNPGPVSFNGYNALNNFLTEDKQKFIDAINYVGENPMPPTGKLGDCYIKQIMIWLAAGHPNN